MVKELFMNRHAHSEFLIANFELDSGGPSGGGGGFCFFLGRLRSGRQTWPVAETVVDIAQVEEAGQTQGPESQDRELDRPKIFRRVQQFPRRSKAPAHGDDGVKGEFITSRA